MGRKPNQLQTPAQSNFDSSKLDEAGQAAQDLAVMHTQNDEVLAAGMDLGRLEAMDFFLTVSSAAMLSIYENVKKSKAWQFLRNPNNSHGKNFESLDEFCEVKLGRSYKRLQAMAGNRKAIGDEAFEQAEKIGLRQVDFNAIKALPAPDQEMISQALREDATKDEVLNTLQALAAKHSKEKEELQKSLEDMTGEREAALESAGNRTKEVTKLKAQLSRINKLPPDDALIELTEEATALATEAAGMVLGNVRQGLQALVDHAAKHGGDVGVTMAGMVGQIQRELTRLRTEFDLPDVSNAADEVLAAEVAQWAR